jgi:cell wall-associated NlpC family hydrolase
MCWPAARVVATSLNEQAKQALTRQQAAARKLQQARLVAEQRAQAARSALAQQTAQRRKLLVELAAARKTTVAVERAREAGLRRAAELRRAAAQRAAARAAARAAQRAAAEEAARNARRSGGGSGNSGGAGDRSAGSGYSEPAPSGSSSGSSSAGESAIAWAKQRLGMPYQWGGAGPDSYDCSGLVMRAWEQAGVFLPHSSRLQYEQTEKVSLSQLRPGDLVFFATDTSNPGTIHHVAMYIGGGQMIEAPYTGANVRISPLRQVDSMPYGGRP